ncbi:MAG TPA: DUF6588 family protein [Bacteroidales bacterium]
MKKIILKLTLGLFVAGFACNAYSQLDDVTKVLNGGVADAQKLMQAYAEPMGKGFALSLTNGWYNTATVHKVLGFDLTFSAGLANAPSSLQTYDAAKLGLTALTVQGNSIGQTISGKDEDGPTLVPKTQVAGQNLPGFKMPGGLGVSFVPMAQIQAGIGLPFGNEIIVRFMPTIKLNASSFNLKLGSWGVGVKHDIKQWIPVAKEVPFWGLSALVSYTKFKASSSGTLLTPDESMYYKDLINTANYAGQGVELNASAMMFGIQASSDIPVINVYGGIGLVTAASNIKLTGNYPTPKAPTENQIISHGGDVKFAINDVKDPIDLKFSSKTAFRANIGLRLKLALLTIHGDISTCNSYFLYSAGMGISFR